MAKRPATIAELFCLSICLKVKMSINEPDLYALLPSLELSVLHVLTMLVVRQLCTNSLTAASAWQ